MHSIRAALLSECAQCCNGHVGVSDVTHVTSSKVRTIVMRTKRDCECEIAWNRMRSCESSPVPKRTRAHGQKEAEGTINVRNGP